MSVNLTKERARFSTLTLSLTKFMGLGYCYEQAIAILILPLHFGLTQNEAKTQVRITLPPGIGHEFRPGAPAKSPFMTSLQRMARNSDGLTHRVLRLKLK